jgi:hypothetical protein
MNLNSAALKMMIAKGLTLEDVAEIVAANEVTRDPTAAERQARYRARKQSETSRRNVTRNTPLNEDILNPPNTPTPSGVGPGPVEKKSRGTRLPDNWQLPAEGAAFAKSKRRWADTEIAEEATLFANYWQSRSGAGAVHRDWNKTCRTGSSNRIGQMARAESQSNSPPSNSGNAPSGSCATDNLTGQTSAARRQSKKSGCKQLSGRVTWLNEDASVRTDPATSRGD